MTLTAAAPRGGGASRATIWYLQWLRALGAVAIVLLHAVRAVELAPALVAVSPALIYGESLAIIPLTRWAVPVFFMMSGALMLDPARSMPARKLVRHVWRIVFVLLTFGLAFCIIEAGYDARSLNGQVLLTALVNLLTGHSWDHLWYLYATIGLYLVTPLLRWLVRKVSWPGVLALCLVSWLLCCVPSSLMILGWVDGGVAALDSACGWAFPLPYYLTGYVLHHEDGHLTGLRSARLVLYALGAGALILMVWLASAYGLTQFSMPEQVLILPYGVACFVAARQLLDKRQIGARWISVLADYSLGIYVIHPLFGHLLIYPLAIQQLAISAGVPGVLALQLAIVLLGVFASMLITEAARTIPAFKGKM